MNDSESGRAVTITPKKMVEMFAPVRATAAELPVASFLLETFVFRLCVHGSYNRRRGGTPENYKRGNHVQFITRANPNKVIKRRTERRTDDTRVSGTKHHPSIVVASPHIKSLSGLAAESPVSRQVHRVCLPDIPE